MEQFRAKQHRMPPDPKLARPTTAPPQFIPNKAQAIQVDMHDDKDDGQMLIGGFGKQYGGKMKQGKGKGGKQTKAIDPGLMYPCLYKYVYIWPRGRRQEPYWMYVTYIGRQSIAGWRYNRRYWVYYGTSLRDIESFYCY